MSRHWPWALCYLPGSLNKALILDQLDCERLREMSDEPILFRKAPQQVSSREIFHGSR